MTITKKVILGTTALIALLPIAAFANLAAGNTIGTTADEVTAALEAQGYEIIEVEVEDGEIEVEYMDNGQLFEVEVDATTGMIAELELEDEDDGDDDDDDDENDSDDDDDDNDDD